MQEYLDGPEFTIDVLCDFRHRPISIVPRERVVVRAGVIDRGRTVHDRTLIELAKSVTQALPFSGAINIQCRRGQRRAGGVRDQPAVLRRHSADHRRRRRFSAHLVDLALGRRGSRSHRSVPRPACG